MAETSTFVKVDRNILKWRWYQDANTMRVFLHLLLMANVADHDFEKITVHRGELVTSLKSLSRQLDISVRSVRTALDHLKTTGEVTSTEYAHYRVISIPEYDRYQAVPTRQTTSKRQASDKQVTSKRQQSKNIKNDKNEKNGKNVCPTHIPALAEVEVYFREHGRSLEDAGKFFAYNTAKGWKIGRTPIEDWHSAADMWFAQGHDAAGAEDDGLDDFGRPIRKEYV